MRTSRLVAMTTGYSVQPNKAVVGCQRVRARERHPPARRARATARPTRSWTRSRSAWRATRWCWASTPGRHAFVDALDKIGITLDDAALNRSFARFKDLADRKVQITDHDLTAIVAEELGAADDDLLVLESVVVGGGTHLQPRATVHLRKGDETIEESAIGDGLIDAAMGAHRASLPAWRRDS